MYIVRTKPDPEEGSASSKKIRNLLTDAATEALEFAQAAQMIEDEPHITDIMIFELEPGRSYSMDDFDRFASTPFPNSPWAYKAEWSRLGSNTSAWGEKMSEAFIQASGAIAPA